MVALMLCRMAFILSGKVVAFHLDNSTTKAYIYLIKVVQFLFLFWTSLQHNESG